MASRNVLPAVLPSAVLASLVFLMTPSAQAAAAAQPAASQQAAAQKAEQDGVPLSALAANAPDSYTIKKGDTLWSVSKVFLKAPWRWPELWGMNKQQIKNPNLIYPGQVLFLEKSQGRARLHAGHMVGMQGESAGGFVRVSPKVRVSTLQSEAILPIPNNLIEPFLNKALIVDPKDFAQAPRFVATQENRSILSKGDRGYVRAWRAGDLSMAPGTPLSYRIYRNAEPLRDPTTKEILAYEAHYLGRAELVRPAGEVAANAAVDGDAAAANDAASPVQPLLNEDKTRGSSSDGGSAGEESSNKANNAQTGYWYNTKSGSTSNGSDSDGGSSNWQNSWHSTYKGFFDDSPGAEKDAHIIPATVDITSSVEEIRMGDRLGPDVDQNALSVYIPHPAPAHMQARILSVYSGEDNGGQNQIVAINKGARDGLDRGAVLTLINKGQLQRDSTDSSDPLMRLPNEVNGHMMVFSVFDKVAYALVLEIQNPVHIGDYAIDPASSENAALEGK